MVEHTIRHRPRQENNTRSSVGLIVGLVLGLAGAAILIAGSIFGYGRYRIKQRSQRLINDEPNLESPPLNRHQQNNKTPIDVVKSTDNDVRIIRRPSLSSPDLSNMNYNQIHAPLPGSANERRVPSAAMSVTTLGELTQDNQQSSSKSMPVVELIRFD